MQITKVRLTNFGKHKSIQWDSKGSVVGIIGQNYQGKSTILLGIEFAFTGKLPRDRDQQSFVRHGENNGSVEVHFEIQGKKGILFRQVGKSPKRSFKWDGETLTKASEVDRVLQSIFEADKEAVSSTVFINQGTIADLLFGTPMERETSFLKLINFHYCEKRVQQIESTIQQYSTNIENLTTLSDEVEKQRNEALESLNAVEKERNEVKDFSKLISTLQEVLTKDEEATKLEEELDSVVKELRIKDERKDFISKNFPKDPVVYERECYEERQNLLSRKESLQKMLEHRGTLERLQGDIKEFNHEFEELQKRIPKGYSSYDAYLTDVVKKIDELKTLSYEKKQQDKLKTKHKKDSEMLAKVSSELEELKKEDLEAMDEHLQETQEELHSLKHQLDQKNTYRENQKKILESGGCTGNKETCSLCNREVVAGVISEASVKSLEKEIADLQKAFGATSVKKHNLKRDLEEKKAQITKTQATVQDNLKRVQEFLMDPLFQKSFDKTYEDYETELKEQEQLHSLAKGGADKYKDLKYKIESLKTRVADCKKLLQDAPEDLSSNSIDKLDEQIKKVTLTEDQKRHLSELDVLGKSILSLEANKQSLEKRIKALYEKIKVLENAECFKDMPERFWDENKHFASHSEEALEKLKLAQKEFDEINGKYLAVKESYEKANKRYHAVQDRIEENRHKMTVIDELSRMKKVLSRESLPRLFVQDMFAKVAVLTKKYLTMMNEDFDIEMSDSSPVSFNVVEYREDSDSPIVLPQTCMSGGQKVRLTIAFLLAAQQILVPQVGMLVLDEPSVHLDEKGVEGLCQMLQNLQQLFRDNDIQLFLVDHNINLQEVLENAYVL